MDTARTKQSDADRRRELQQVTSQTYRSYALIMTYERIRRSRELAAETLRILEKLERLTTGRRSFEPLNPEARSV